MLARAPMLATRLQSQPNEKIRLLVSVVTDANDNLAEYWGDTNGTALLVESSTFDPMLRILQRNEIVKLDAAPGIVVSAGDESTVEVARLKVAVTPHVTADGDLLLKSQVEQGPYGTTVEANAVLRQGDALLMRVFRDEGGASDQPDGRGANKTAKAGNSATTYVAITAHAQQ